MHEILESETMTTVALASEKIIARNKIFRVAGPFLLSVLAFKCKVLFKSRQVSTAPSVSLIALLSRPFPPSLSHPLCLPLLFSLSPPLFPLLLPFDSISFILYSSLPRRRSRTQQLRRPWDKRLHFLIFKCVQTSYPAIVCPTEALPRRGFRADKPFQPSMHAGLQRCCILPLCSLSLSLSLFCRTLPRFPSLFLLARTIQLCGVGPRCGSSRWKMQIANARATVMKS